MDTYGRPDECVGNGPDDQDEHDGDVHLYESVSGASQSWRCAAHQRRYEERMRPIVAEVRRNYPDSDTPPDWFDPSYAGESWNEPE